MLVTMQIHVERVSRCCQICMGMKAGAQQGSWKGGHVEGDPPPPPR